MIAETPNGQKRNRPNKVQAAVKVRKEGDRRKVVLTKAHKNLVSKTVSYQQQLSKNLRALRQSMKLSQQAFADKVGVFRTTIIRIESGETCPSFAEACMFADVFGVSVDCLARDMTWIFAMDNAGSLSEALRDVRLLDNLSQDQAAERCRMSRSEFCEIESGRVKPSAETLLKLATAFSRPVLLSEAG